jgi:hypothetical protein
VTLLVNSIVGNSSGIELMGNNEVQGLYGSKTPRLLRGSRDIVVKGRLHPSPLQTSALKTISSRNP